MAALKRAKDLEEREVSARDESNYKARRFVPEAVVEPSLLERRVYGSPSRTGWCMGGSWGTVP